MKKSPSGFTLIELSIVLVIIGLIVGGVLVGKDLIEAASLRAQITQIEKFNTALTTFRLKYNCIPGDCRNAAQFGFLARGSNGGQGDGNSIIEGYSNSSGKSGIRQSGEPTLFWRDLSEAGLIEGTYNSANFTTPSPSITSDMLSQYLPPAKIGNGNYVYVHSGWARESDGNPQSNGLSYYTIDGVDSMDTNGGVSTFRALTQIAAHNIDTKIDDGLAQKGKTIAQFTNQNAPYLAKPGAWGYYNSSSAMGGSASTCYDNRGVAGNDMIYSTQPNNGTNVVCSLSIQIPIP